MLEQVLRVHKEVLPSLPFFHIGADEAFQVLPLLVNKRQVGECEADVYKLSTQFENSTKRLILNHLKTLSEAILSRSPETRVRPFGLRESRRFWHGSTN